MGLTFYSLLSPKKKKINKIWKRKTGGRPRLDPYGSQDRGGLGSGPPLGGWRGEGVTFQNTPQKDDSIVLFINPPLESALPFRGRDSATISRAREAPRCGPTISGERKEARSAATISREHKAKPLGRRPGSARTKKNPRRINSGGGLANPDSFDIVFTV